MDVTGILIALLIFGILAYLAYFVITKFLKEPMQTPALAITGVILLIILLSYAGGYIPISHSFIVR